MAKHRARSIEFKRQIAEDFIAGETLHALASRHDISLRQRCANLRLAAQKRGWPEITPSAQNSPKARRDAIAVYPASATSSLHAP